MATREQIRNTLELVYEIAKTICDTSKETGMPVPQGPMYAALMGSITIGGWRAIVRELERMGFIATAETIEPSPEIKALMTKKTG